MKKFSRVIEQGGVRASQTPPQETKGVFVKKIFVEELAYNAKLDYIWVPDHEYEEIFQIGSLLVEIWPISTFSHNDVITTLINYNSSAFEDTQKRIAYSESAYSN